MINKKRCYNASLFHIRVLTIWIRSGSGEHNLKGIHACPQENYFLDISWNILLPAKIGIDDTELCVIIGNLLENAIRASEKLPPSDRIIEAMIRMVSEKMIGIEIRNHYQGKIYLNREGFPTSRENEGIGLMSVSNTVRKNNGHFSVEVDNEWFSVDIIINT